MEGGRERNKRKKRETGGGIHLKTYDQKAKKPFMVIHPFSLVSTVTAIS